MRQWLKRQWLKRMSSRQREKGLGWRTIQFTGMVGAIALSIFPLTDRVVIGLDLVPDDANQASETVVENADMAQLPDILFDIIPAEIIPDSEFISQISELVRTVGDRQGQYAVLTAGVLANPDPNISRWLAALEASPFQDVEINGLELGTFAQQLAVTLEQRNAAVDAIARQADQEALAYSTVNYANLPDLRQAGGQGVQMQTLSISDTGDSDTDPEADRDPETATENGMTVDAYFPESLLMGELMGIEPDAAPVILISHGVGGNASDFAALAQHLASYGFVVVVPNHAQLAANGNESPTSSLDNLRDQFFGAMNPLELVRRPLTLSAILDEMERLNQTNPMIQGRLDLDNVGVIGHSLGGYTGLAMVTGDISRRQLRRTCNDDETLALNLSLLLQCQARALPRRLPSLYDDRIKAVMALNPVGSAILGESQIEDIEVPVMVVAGSHDAIAPMLSEQLPVFSWLDDSHDKYLATLVPGGHASANVSANVMANDADSEDADSDDADSDDVDSEENSGTSRSNDLVDQIITGPLDPQGGAATKALSVAFMAAHLASPVADEIPTDAYLNAAYSEFLSEGLFDLHLITEWNELGNE
ncbi:MAG: alpha/beta fold hydrolase [Cyanothece sp. SIO2G6]|nr:alpha/beta fold hydrolase [Cyanothece sp. SIO2G6]